MTASWLCVQCESTITSDLALTLFFRSRRESHFRSARGERRRGTAQTLVTLHDIFFSDRKLGRASTERHRFVCRRCDKRRATRFRPLAVDQVATALLQAADECEVRLEEFRQRASAHRLPLQIFVFGSTGCLVCNERLRQALVRALRHSAQSAGAAQLHPVY